MGSFATTLFSVLTEMIKRMISGLWALISGESSGGFIAWVLDNWLMLVILLCVAGVLIDLVIYLIRWQPYRVWRNRRRGEEEELEAEMPAEAPQVEVRRWVYADGSMTVEETLPEPEPEPMIETAPLLSAEHEELQLRTPVRPVRRVIPARRRRAPDGSDEYLLPDLGGEKQAYHKPYYPPQWNSGEQQMIDEGDNA